MAAKLEYAGKLRTSHKISIPPKGDIATKIAHGDDRANRQNAALVSLGHWST